MKFRAAGIVAVALLLCGCSDADWDHLLKFGPSGNSEASSDQAAPADTSAPPTAEAAAPSADVAAVAPQPSYSVTTTTTTVTHDSVSSYCSNVARNTGAVATRDGMDGAGQQQAADATLRQCEAFYGPSGH